MTKGLGMRKGRAEAKKAAVDAAMAVAADVADGRVDATDLEQAVVEECRRLFGTVIGPDDPVWELHVQVCRAVLAVGGVAADELAEWAAVQARAEETGVALVVADCSDVDVEVNQAVDAEPVEE